MTEHAPAGSVCGGRGEGPAALPPLQPSHDHARLARVRCRQHLPADPAEHHRAARDVDRPAARTIQRRPDELGPDPASRTGQRAVRPPARRGHCLPFRQQPGPQAKPVRPGPGDAAAEAGRERVLDQAAVVLRSLPGLLEADRLDLVKPPQNSPASAIRTSPIRAARVTGASARSRSIGSSSGGGFRSVTVTAGGASRSETGCRHAASRPAKYPPCAECGGPLNRAGTIRTASATAAIVPAAGLPCRLSAGHARLLPVRRRGLGLGDRWLCRARRRRGEGRLRVRMPGDGLYERGGVSGYPPDEKAHHHDR
jgi:hypothetical protein